MLKNLDHRGACGCEINTGDGAGVLLQMPHAFNEEVCRKARIPLPAAGQYGSGIIFLPRNPTVRRQVEQKFEQVVQSEGQTVLGWRTVPTHNGMLGETARSCEPFMRQVFIQRSADIADDLAFERKLYVIRKRAYNEIRTSTLAGAEYWYIVSLSARTIVYKGMLLTTQLDQYFPDLHNPLMETALALVHSRFSTNTFPSWDRAHPYRYIAHNGEINTVRGNANWMHAREARFEAEAFGDDIRKIRPIINPNGSDSGMFDNTLELLYLSGRSLPHAVMMMIPEPWSNHETMDDQKRAFYQYHSSLMEPWDGPASISFTDGTQIGAVLDRNGLRPGRYYVTKDDLVIMASEAGVLDVPAGRHRAQGPPAAGPHVPGRHGTGPHRRGRGDQARDRDRAAVPRVAERIPDPRRGPAAAARTAATRSGHAAAAPGGVWLHVRRPAHRHRADGDGGRRSRRLDGQRHAAGRAVEQAAPAVRLFQAVVRAGHEPADRLHPRRDRHLRPRRAWVPKATC